ncbi:MAG TPA: oligosaccharide flippase family protein [Patescibacteria group bacterium]|jgi:O-antigen/teichoic acid export membrane protein|nr:oligosaccharide flippase family protein [Patescibacteria group bacterium]
MSSTFRPAFALMSGRIVGGLAASVIPLVLVRLLDPAEFGTYKQVFLIYATLFGIAQIGMAESLYYFLPHEARHAGRFVANSLLVLLGAGLLCLGLLVIAAPAVSRAMNNPALAGSLGMLGVYLALMLVSNVLEIAMAARGRFLLAASSFAAFELLRSALFIVPVLLFGSVRALLAGAALFAVVRLSAAVAWLWREYRSELRFDLPLLRVQVAYAIPFAAAVLVHILQENFHQYAVSARFDAAVFAVYAVGCLQIPLVDILSTSVSSVMMVRMAEDKAGGRTDLILPNWHDTTRKLALVFFPLVGLVLVNARAIIQVLFTEKFLASAPILMLWSLAFLAAILQIDGVLRVYADTRFLLLMNLCRLGLVLLLIHPFLNLFGLRGALMVMLLTLFTGKAMALLRIGHLMKAGVREILPWFDLGRIFAASAAALLPALLIRTTLPLSPWMSLMATGSVYALSCATLLLLFRAATIPHLVIDSAWMGRRVAWLPAIVRRLSPTSGD